MTDKPERLQAIEALWRDDIRRVLFEESDSDYWMVYFRGVFQGFEIKEIAEALEEVNDE